MIACDLDALISSLRTKFAKEKVWIDLLQTLRDELGTLSVAVANPHKLYAAITSKCTKVYVTLMDSILQIGQKQIIRKLIASELNSSCKFKSQNLDSALRTMNE